MPADFILHRPRYGYRQTLLGVLTSRRISGDGIRKARRDALHSKRRKQMLVHLHQLRPHHLLLPSPSFAASQIVQSQK